MLDSTRVQLKVYATFGDKRAKLEFLFVHRRDWSGKLQQFVLLTHWKFKI